jgi:predicted nucleic acid-binding protein
MANVSVFVDINIFIDVTEKRFKWQDSAALLETVKQERAKGHISAITKAVIYFRRSRITSDKQARHDVQEITKGFKIVDLSESILDDAFADERFRDVEDAIQFHSCISIGRILVTRNKRDYSTVAGEIELLSPDEFLKKYLT